MNLLSSYIFNLFIISSNIWREYEFCYFQDMIVKNLSYRLKWFTIYRIYPTIVLFFILYSSQDMDYLENYTFIVDSNRLKHLLFRKKKPKKKFFKKTFLFQPLGRSIYITESNTLRLL